jgi:chaperonin GroEL (HSP60 family)
MADCGAQAGEEGVLPGGGIALLRAIEALDNVKVHNDDQRTGIDIVKKALSWPARQIAMNAGEDGSILVGKILDKDINAFGFDAQAGEPTLPVVMENAVAEGDHYRQRIVPPGTGVNVTGRTP